MAGSLRSALVLSLSVAGVASLHAEETKVDRFGDPLPEGALARLGTTRFRVGAQVLALQFSANGERLHSFGADGKIHVWSVPMRSELSRVTIAGDPCGEAFQFSPDGRFLVTAGGATNHLIWSAVTGAAIKPVLPGDASVYAFSADGHLAAIRRGTDPSTLDVADTITGKVVARLGEAIVTTKARSWVRSGLVAFSPDGQTLASIAGIKSSSLSRVVDMLELWSISSATCVAAVDLDAEPNEREDFIGAPLLRHKAQPFLAFTRDGHLLTLDRGFDRSLRDPKNGKLLKRVPAPLAASADASVLLLDGLCVHDRNKRTETRLGLEPNPAAAYAVSDDGKLVAVAERHGRITLYNSNTGKPLILDHEPVGPVTDVAYASSGNSILATTDETVTVWNRPWGRPARFGDWRRPPIAISPDGDTVATGPKAQLFSLATGRELADLKHPMWTIALAFSQDGKRLASGARLGTIVISEITSQTDTRLTADYDPSSSRFTADGRSLLAGERHGIVQLLDTATGKEIARYAGTRAELTADEKSIVTLDGRGGARFFDRASGNLWRQEGTEAEPATALALSGDLYAIAIGVEIRICDLATANVLRRFMSPQGRVTALAFSPDRKELASGGADTTVLVWPVPPR